MWSTVSNNQCRDRRIAESELAVDYESAVANKILKERNQQFTNHSNYHGWRGGESRPIKTRRLRAEQIARFSSELLDLSPLVSGYGLRLIPGCSPTTDPIKHYAR